MIITSSETCFVKKCMATNLKAQKQMRRLRMITTTIWYTAETEVQRLGIVITGREVYGRP
jgi:hypothetical protein